MLSFWNRLAVFSARKERQPSPYKQQSIAMDGKRIASSKSMTILLCKSEAMGSLVRPNAGFFSNSWTFCSSERSAISYICCGDQDVSREIVLFPTP